MRYCERLNYGHGLTTGILDTPIPHLIQNNMSFEQSAEIRLFENHDEDDEAIEGATKEIPNQDDLPKQPRDSSSVSSCTLSMFSMSPESTDLGQQTKGSYGDILDVLNKLEGEEGSGEAVTTPKTRTEAKEESRCSTVKSADKIR